jgi:hypothetical protein
MSQNIKESMCQLEYRAGRSHTIAKICSRCVRHRSEAEFGVSRKRNFAEVPVNSEF